MSPETERRMLDWAASHKLKESRCKYQCLHWVQKGGCYVHYMCRNGKLEYRWMDHVTLWTKKGKRLLYAQPYGLRASEFASLSAAVQEFNLDCRIHGYGWYGSGTICIELTPKGQESWMEYQPHQRYDMRNVLQLSDYR